MAKRPLARLDTVNGIELLFDKRPIEIGKFRLGARSASPIGRPSLEGWRAALEFACASHEGSPYWIGDLMAYSDSREDWRDKIDQAMVVTGLALQTLKNLGYISRHVEEHERLLAPTPAHAAEVASLERPEQTKYLENARAEGLTVREMRLQIRADRRRRIIDGQAQLEGMYRVIYADPSWPYGDRPPSGVGVEEHYPTMTIEDLCKLPVQAHALPDSVLLMWTTAPVILQHPGPREVGEAWGFTYKQQYIWDKVERNWGNYTGGNHEILTIWTRGSCLPDVQIDLPDSVQVIRKSEVHSAKPEEFRRLIEKHWTHGPYLELFGRERVEGWAVFGNDARLWAQEAEAADGQGAATHG
jgi:N6-adenosine-specific RNA methylase IME4